MLKRSMALIRNDAVHMTGWVSDWDKGMMPWVGLMVLMAGRGGSGVTGGLSNGGSGGSTGSSVGMMSILWCFGTERNLGHCFGNQGGGQCAKRQGEMEGKHLLRSY